MNQLINDQASEQRTEHEKTINKNSYIIEVICFRKPMNANNSTRIKYFNSNASVFFFLKQNLLALIIYSHLLNRNTDSTLLQIRKLRWAKFYILRVRIKMQMSYGSQNCR